MRGVAANLKAPVRPLPWQLEVAQLLDEHHVCAWSADPLLRDRFAADLTALLSQLEHTQVCEIHGGRARDLPSFCVELARAIGVGEIEPRIDADAGVVGALRRRPPPAPASTTSPALKRRYLIWADAHVLLREDPRLFGRLADAIAGVAAQEELEGEDLLLLQRAVYLGRPALDVYASDPRGQFRAWYTEHAEPALWQVVTGLPGPRVVSWRISADLAPADA